ncbi:hypothetical protein GDO81_022031, partial [Engystomops pustulosus]
MDDDDFDDCADDDQCSGSEKCCCTAFGRRCVSPVQVKLGRCPPPGAACSHMSSKSSCDSDEDCPGSQRCCDICGKTCWNPEPDPDGFCPVPDIIPVSPSCSQVQCASDSECNSEEKCCLQPEGLRCVGIPSALNAQDVCPSVKNQFCLSPQTDECKNDSECSAPQKCCCSDCRRKCVQPEKVKPGRCPPQPPGCRGKYFTPNCQRDDNCPKTQKCCDVCGKRCMDPNAEPPGVCPVPDLPDDHHLQCSSVTCSRDGDCAPHRKCCLTEEGQKCVQPQP